MGCRIAEEQPGGGSCDHPAVAAAASGGQEPEGAVVLVADCVTSVDSCSVIAVGSCPYSSFRSCLHW